MPAADVVCICLWTANGCIKGFIAIPDTTVIALMQSTDISKQCALFKCRLPASVLLQSMSRDVKPCHAFLTSEAHLQLVKVANQEDISVCLGLAQICRLLQSHCMGPRLLLHPLDNVIPAEKGQLHPQVFTS